MDPYPTMCSARFGIDPDYRSGSRAKSRFSSLSPKLIIGASIMISLNVGLGKGYLSYSGQELPFIFFELRAPTCLWGRYDPKTKTFILFYIYLLHIDSLSKTFYVPHLALLHIWQMKSHSGSGSRLVSKFSFLSNFVNFAHRNMYDTSK